MNYYQRHIGDYLKATAHLSLLEHGIYCRLLDVYYTRDGPIPDDQACRLVGARSAQEKAALLSILSEFFTRDGDVWRQKRCDEEIDRYMEKSASASASAHARWAKSQTERNANAMRTQSDGNAPNNQEPVTSNQEPKTKEKPSEAIASGGRPPPKDPQEIIFGYGVPLLTNAGATEKVARSFLGKLRKNYDDPAIVNVLRDCVKAKPLQPLEWLAAALPPPTMQAQSLTKVGQQAAAAAQAWLETQ